MALEESSAKLGAGKQTEGFSELVDKAENILRRTAVDPAFESDDAKQEQFPYVVLQHQDIVTDVIYTWLKEASNVQRASLAVGRKPSGLAISLLSSWSAIRTEHLDFPGKVKAGPTPNTTMVLLALEDLTVKGQNIKRGGDLCMDAADKIVFPPNQGERLAILFELHL
jgi:hypothetical protein